MLSSPNTASTSAGVSQVTKIDIAGVKPKPWVTGLLKAMNGRFASVNLIVCPGPSGPVTSVIVEFGISSTYRSTASRAEPS